MIELQIELQREELILIKKVLADYTYKLGWELMPSLLSNILKLNVKIDDYLNRTLCNDKIHALYETEDCFNFCPECGKNLQPETGASHD